MPSEAGAASHQSNMFPRHGILAALDEQQRAAAAITSGPVLIVAGPGSGKTRTLTHRIAHLVAEEGVPAQNCLAITFTPSRGQEMRERLERLLPNDADRVPIHTFHSLGQTILQEQPKAARLPADFRVADDLERTELIKALLDVAPRQARKLLADISRSKRTAQRASDEVAAALEVYQPELVRRGWVDFDDLIGLTVRLLRNDDRLAAFYRGALRLDLGRRVPGYRRTAISHGPAPGPPGHPERMPISWRSAIPTRRSTAFGAPIPGVSNAFARIIRTHERSRSRRNYRSSGTIVKASAEVIEAGEEGASAGLDHMRQMEERITVHRAASDKAEAEIHHPQHRTPDRRAQFLFYRQRPDRRWRRDGRCRPIDRRSR